MTTTSPLQFRSCTDKKKRNLVSERGLISLSWTGRTGYRKVHRQASGTKRMALGFEPSAGVDDILSSILNPVS
jgi:hypothetical protein